MRFPKKRTLDLAVILLGFPLDAAGRLLAGGEFHAVLLAVANDWTRILAILYLMKLIGGLIYDASKPDLKDDEE